MWVYLVCDENCAVFEVCKSKILANKIATTLGNEFTNKKYHVEKWEVEENEATEVDGD